MMIVPYLAKPKGKTLENDLRIRTEQHRKAWQYTQIMRLYRMAHALCERCLVNDEFTPCEEAHHIKPLCEGGSDHDSNLLALCKPCHKTIDEITQEKQREWKEKLK
jgi:5-methylcytosine-specific restriction protein A